MQPVRLATILTLCALCFLGQDGSARSILNNIPGAALMEDLTRNFIGTFGDILDSSINRLGSELDAIEELVDCNDSSAIGCSPPDPDTKRNVSQIIESRGFRAEEYDVVTRDGYILTIQRIVNPLIDRKKYSLKPVILQHGLMSSSVDWVINSLNVKPEPFPASSAEASSASYGEDEALRNTVRGHRMSLEEDVDHDQEHPRALGFYLANRGYDVFLANSRGNIYGQRHVKMSSWLPKFWDFTFDEQIKYDLPDTIEFVQKLTKQTKVGYVGHSQGTTMMLGLLSDRPEYADIVEPVILLAPVAFANNCISPVKYFAVYTPLFTHVNMWFGSSNLAVRFLAPKVCGPKMIRKEICANIIFLSSGFDEAELNDTRVSAYMNHMPSGTSVKNVAHWGQAVLSGRFAHFDHGILGNQVKYGQAHPPDYDLGKIRSKSISLFTAENDWLASPKDVARLKAALKVPLFRTVNVTEQVPGWNHIDFVYGIDSGRLINIPALEIFDHFNK